MPQTFNVGARSLFVTVTAWAFIFLALFAGLSALTQHAPATETPLPGLSGLLAVYLPWLLRAGLALALLTLASAFGLLLRLDWARRSFILLLGIAIAANLLGLWLQQELLQVVVAQAVGRTSMSPQAADVFGGFVTATRAMAVALTLAACALLAWIMRRLMSPAVRQEFA